MRSQLPWLKIVTRVFVAGLATLSLAMNAPAAEAQTNRANFKFDFGPGRVAPGWIQVLPTTIYTRELGYGFDPGSKVSAVDRGGDDPLRGDFCTSGQPFFFSVALPEGNYKVTVTLGDLSGASATTIKAESRRLMLERARTAAGKFETRAFTVNLRTPRISSRLCQ